MNDASHPALQEAIVQPATLPPILGDAMDPELLRALLAQNTQAANDSADAI